MMCLTAVTKYMPEKNSSFSLVAAVGVPSIPKEYNKILTGTFVDGSKVFNIPVSYIVDEETSQTLTSANFNITYSIPNENPIASSIEIGSFTNDPGTGLQVIPVPVNAVEYASSTWQNLTGVKTVHFVISIVV